MSDAATNPIIVALDVPSLGDARALAAKLGDSVGALKVGLELFSAEGKAAVRAFPEHRVFLDAKLHDIPTTVARAVRALAPLGLELLNVHALGGRAMMEAANEQKGDTKLLAVTVLTSFDDAALKEVGLPPAAESVPHLARLAFESGCDGVVCAPPDVDAVRAVCPPPFMIVTPGVRPTGADRNEQVRVLTPREAIEKGADRIVVGRPITRAADPRAAAQAILAELA